MGQNIAANTDHREKDRVDRMKTIMALGVVLVALGSLMAPPAMADPDLEA